MEGTGQVLYNYLLLLGLTPAGTAKDHNVELGEAMFSRANHKGVDVVLHALFERIRGKEALRKVRIKQPCQLLGLTCLAFMTRIC